jgi:hypothetical protein
VVANFDSLPSASIIDGKVFCMHGAMSTFDHALERAATINALQRVADMQMNKGGKNRKFRLELAKRPRHHKGVQEAEAGQAVAEFRRKAAVNRGQVRQRAKVRKEKIAKAVGYMVGQDLMGALVRLPSPMTGKEDLWATRVQRRVDGDEPETRHKSTNLGASSLACFRLAVMPPCAANNQFLGFCSQRQSGGTAAPSAQRQANRSMFVTEGVDEDEGGEQESKQDQEGGDEQESKQGRGGGMGVVSGSSTGEIQCSDAL